MLAAGFWTSEHVLVVLNAILATAALVTALVGVMTIRSANQVAELDRQTLAASVRPLVVGVADEQGKAAVSRQDRNDGSVHLGVPLKNIGSGPAIIHSVQFVSDIGSAGWATDEKIVAADSQAKAWGTFASADALKSALSRMQFALQVFYSDLGGNQRTESFVIFGGQADWIVVHKIELYSCDENWHRAELQVASGAPSA